MIGKLQQNERELFRTRLEDLINPHHELALLANKIDWTYFENEFKPYYSDNGQWLWIEQKIRLKISEAIAETLINGKI